MKAGWRRLLIGVALGAAAAVLTMIFLAYQMPELLIDWVNLRYCG
jgi:predicted small secreted protein